MYNDNLILCRVSFSFTSSVYTYKVPNGMNLRVGDKLLVMYGGTMEVGEVYETNVEKPDHLPDEAIYEIMYKIAGKKKLRLI